MPLTFLVFDDDFRERFYWSIRPVFQLLLCDAHCEAGPIWQVLCPVVLPAIANYAKNYRKNSSSNNKRLTFFKSTISWRRQITLGETVLGSLPRVFLFSMTWSI